jgi:hypothetical protein
MARATEQAASGREVERSAHREALRIVQDQGLDPMVGGAYALKVHTGIWRDTKDLDLFVRKEDVPGALAALSRAGYRTEITDPLWIAKAYSGPYFVDLIFSSGNGVAEVDDEWFKNAGTGMVFGHRVQIVPAEEMIWSKAFVLERERYDGADVNHLLRAAGADMDWDRLMRRFDRYWEVLLSHLMLFRFTYPSDRDLVPGWVMVELMRRTGASVREGNWEQGICRGNLLSKVNYGVDIREWGYEDGRKWDEEQRKEALDRGEGHQLEAADSSSR